MSTGTQTTEAWSDFLAAVAFVQQQFEQWQTAGAIGDKAGRALAGYYREWREQLEVARGVGKLPPTARIGLPPQAPVLENLVELSQRIRYLTFLCHEVKKHSDAGQLPLSQAHACMEEAQGRIHSLQNRLDREQILDVLPADAVKPLDRFEHLRSAMDLPPREPRKPFMEILLDPQNIQWLLIVGGLMLVVGLVIYLYTVGIFESPAVIAGLMGTGTIGLLVGGWAILHLTRYKIAGRAVALLACLIMPLNLWFYHAQHLHPFMLHEQMWLAAVACCALYAASAWVLKDRLFVYVFVLGVTLTGLLIQATILGQSEFWQITYPATMLVVLGVLAIHAERAFPPVDESPFSRKHFGLAFFWSGHAVLAVGLLLILVANLIGYSYDANRQLFRFFGLLNPSPITTERPLQFLALCLVLIGTYAYIYSDLVVRRIGVYLYLAVFTLLWAEALAIKLLAVHVTEEVYIIAMSLTALAANLLQPLVTHRATTATGDRADALNFLNRPLANAGQPLGLFLSTIPVFLGLTLHLRSTYVELHNAWPYTVGPGYVLAMLITALSCRVGAYLYRQTVPVVSMIYFFGAGAATLLGAAGLLKLMGLASWDVQAPLVMVVPILYIIAARLYRGHTAEYPLTWVAHAATGVLIVSVIGAALAIVPQHVVIQGQALNLKLALFFVEATLFYALAGIFGKKDFNIYLATATACGALFQLLSYWHVSPHFFTLAFAVVGLVLLIAYRFAVLDQLSVSGLASAAFQSANSLLSLAFVAGAFLTLAEVAAGLREEKGALVRMLIGLLGISLLAVGLVRHAGWRRWYVVASVINCVLTVLVLAVFGSLTPAQKLEVVCVVGGLALLVAGHIGWYREHEQHSDTVSFCLSLGSLLAAVPLAFALLYYRSQDIFSWPEELGTLGLGVLLLTTGFMFQLKSTTLTGAAQLVFYVFTLAIYVPWSHLNTLALIIMIGGGGIFGLGLLLSVYRERLLTLPDRIKRREGVFRVLSWR